MSARQPLDGGQLALLTLALSLGVFMIVLDVTIANVAIPNIAGDLAVSPNNGTWVITSFTVSQAIMLPITGWLTRRFGQVRLYVFSTALFIIASILCGLSTNLSMLLFFRVIQGAMSGPMIPLSQSVLLENYPYDKKGLATGIWAMTAVVAPICGPILGGWLTDNLTWPWIFYINIPIGAFSALIPWLLLRGRESVIVKTPIDVIGLVLLIIGIGSLQIILDQGNDMDWFNSNVILTMSILSFTALVFFVIWEYAEEHPIVDLTLFLDRNFSVATLGLTLGFMVYFANVVIFPLWLQTEMGYTPTWAGLAVAPVGILPFFLTPLLGRYMYLVDLRYLISVGFIVFAITAFWQSDFYTQVSFSALIEPRFMQGLGLALFFTPLLTVAIANISSERMTSALGLCNFCRILGGSFGTSLSVTLWNRREAFHHSRLVEHINHFNPMSRETIDQLQQLGLTNHTDMLLIDRLITNQAFMLSTDEVFWLSGCIFVALVFIVWLAKPPFHSGGVHVIAD